MHDNDNDDLATTIISHYSSKETSKKVIANQEVFSEEKNNQLIFLNLILDVSQHYLNVFQKKVNTENRSCVKKNPEVKE